MHLGNVSDLLISIPAILLAISFHEFAHGLAAYRLGDPTPGYQGRLTLNPLAHLDIVGTLLLLVAGFGWAKPVQVNPLYFRGDRRRGMMLVSLAGPLINVVLAYLAAFFISLMVVRQIIPYNPSFFQFFEAVLRFNLVLAAFNLIPIPPLDGSKILAGILPRESAHFIYSLEQFGPILLLLLIVTGLAGKIFFPIINGLAKIIFIATGIPS